MLAWEIKAKSSTWNVNVTNLALPMTKVVIQFKYQHSCRVMSISEKKNNLKPTFHPYEMYSNCAKDPNARTRVLNHRGNISRPWCWSSTPQ